MNGARREDLIPIGNVFITCHESTLIPPLTSDTLNSDCVVHWNLRYVLSESCSMQNQTYVLLEWCGAAFAVTLTQPSGAFLCPQGLPYDQTLCLRQSMAPSSNQRGLNHDSSPAAVGWRSSVPVPRAPRPCHGLGDCQEWVINHLYSPLSSPIIHILKERKNRHPPNWYNHTSLSWAMHLWK